MARLSAMDTLFMSMESDTVGMQGAFLLIYKGDISGIQGNTRYEKLVNKLRACLDDNRVFRRVYHPPKLPVDHGVWRLSQDVDLSHHVRQYVAQHAATPAQLGAIYSDILTRPMDLRKPMWEVHLIDNIVDGDASFALVVKFHHAGVDGVSATAIVKALHTPERAKTGNRGISDDESPALPSAAANYRNFLSDQWHTSQYIGKSLIRSGRKKLASLTQKEIDNVASQLPLTAPRTPINVPLVSERSYTWASLDIDEIKALRSAFPGCSVNDIFLCLCGGALRGMLLETDELPNRSLIAGVPVSQRADPNSDIGGNQFDVMRCPLGTDIEDPAQRLRAISEYMQAYRELREQRGPSAAGAAKAVLDSLPGLWVSLLGNAAGPGKATVLAPPLINLICTNVPGSPVPMDLEGATLVDMNGAPPIMSGLGMVIAASSYCGQLKVGMLAARNVMPVPEYFKTLFEAEFVALSASLKSSSAQG